MRSRLLLAALAFLSVGLPRAARADPTDAPFFTALLAQGLQQLTAMGESLHTARQSYDEAKRVAGYAEDAKSAFNEFQAANGATFGTTLERAVEQAWPDIGYFRTEATRPGPWAQGTGELQRRVQVCVGQMLGPDRRCTDVGEPLKLAQVRTSLAATFGQPVSYETAVVDDEAATAIAASHAAQQRNAVRRRQLEELQARCTAAKEQAACTAAADMAALIAADAALQQADAAATANRLTAVQLAQQNAAQKREAAQGDAQREILRDAAAHIPTAPTVRGAGFDLSSEAR